MLKIRNVIALISLVAIALPTQAFNIEYLLSKAERKASNLLEGVNPKAADNPLTILLSKDLGVNDKQAAGGAGAMLAMAYQALDKDQSNELLKMLPGMDNLTNMIPSNLGSNLKDLSDVNHVFTLLGLDSSMVKKFTPVLLKYIAGKGASNSLLSGLTDLWGK